MRRLLVGLVLLLVHANAADGTLPVEVPPNDPHIYYVGRFDWRDPKGPRCAWSASSITLKFTGGALNVKLNDSGRNHYEVIVDGTVSKVLSPAKGEGTYSVAAGLGDNAHTVTLC